MGDVCRAAMAYPATRPGQQVIEVPRNLDVAGGEEEEVYYSMPCERDNIEENATYTS